MPVGVLRTIRSQCPAACSASRHCRTRVGDHWPIAFQMSRDFVNTSGKFASTSSIALIARHRGDPT